MDKDIQRRVIGILTVAASMATTGTGVEDDVIQGLLFDLFDVRVEVPEPCTAQDVASAMARNLAGPLRDLVMAFCVAFGQLARVNDEGETEMTAEELLQRLALVWERTPDA